MVWFGSFGLVREPRSAPFFIENGLASGWHEGELAVIVNPRAGLVGLFQPPNLVGLIGIGPSVAHLSGLRSPKIHAPRHCCGGVGVAR